MDTNQHQDDGDGRLAGDLLVGAARIKRFLVELGMPESVDPYYLKKTGWPIGKTAGDGGGSLIASERRLVRHAQKLAAG